MDIKVVKFNGMCLVPVEGKRVVIGYDLFFEAPDEPVYEEVYADAYIDLCTGKHFGRIIDEVLTDVTEEPVYKFIAAVESRSISYRHPDKKKMRKERIDKIVGTYFDPNTGIKKYGKTRFLRRRMHPNDAQRYCYCEDLPF